MKDANGLPLSKYEFGSFRLDMGERRLESNGSSVALTPKALDLLSVLVANQGRLLTKDELLQQVWADTCVEESTLVQNIATLRRALGERSRGQQFIETVPKAGYRFVATVNRVEEAPDVDARLVLVEEYSRSRLSVEEIEESVHPGWALGMSRTAALVLAAAVLALGGIWYARQMRTAHSPVPLEFTQLTSFPDSVNSPALSRDGKMLLFIRGGDGFEGGTGEIYLKVLPNGPPVALTHDGLVKMAPTFAPDGSHVIYTQKWSSFSVPTAGGAPALFMPNAAGLTWAGPDRVLFSEIRDAPHMAVATANEGRAYQRDVYVPDSHQGMAHFSYLSPDGKAVLVVEMTTVTGWLQCRVVPFDGSSKGVQVGPPGSRCTAAAWSPDSRWMYLIAEIDGESHLWRQRFASGRPEQLTSGLNQERGIAVEPDGRSVITSVGTAQSTVWYHDERGDRPVSAEGYAYRPQVSSDGVKVYYLVRRAAKRSSWIGELWSADLTSGRIEPVLPNFLVQYFHVARDGKHVVFDSLDGTGRSRLWVASTDRSEPPRRLTPEGNVDEQRPFFGASGAIYFMREESTDRRFVYRMNTDGSGRRKLSDPITFLVNISPDERWAVVWNTPGTSMLPLAGGPAQMLCRCPTGPLYATSPRINWSADSKFLIVGGEPGGAPGAGTRFVRWNGAPWAGDLNGEVIQEMSVTPGPSTGQYAFTRRAEQRNLYRVRLPW
jgi:DNA-binding winged helix-turn-helix (wHTH) protein/Tol biopolymer transport system component